MSGFRLLGQFTQFFLNSGLVNNGGSITFYETDLTTLKNTYSDPALTILNANPVPLDAAGRLSTDVWGSGVYGAVLKNSLGTTIQTLNNIQSGSDPGLVIPTLVASQFLSNDGSNLLWQPVLQPPDPTGQSGKVLGNDGSNLLWQTLPTVSSGSSGAGSFTIGTILVQTGFGILPATGTNTTNFNVTFGTPYSNPPYFVGLTQNDGSGVTSSGRLLILASLSESATGFICWGDINATSGEAPISRATNFKWIAMGPV